MVTREGTKPRAFAAFVQTAPLVDDHKVVGGLPEVTNPPGTAASRVPEGLTRSLKRNPRTLPRVQTRPSRDHQNRDGGVCGSSATMTLALALKKPVGEAAGSDFHVSPSKDSHVPDCLLSPDSPVMRKPAAI